MTEYRANRLTSIFPLGIIAKGEKLSSRHIEALGPTIIEGMVRRGLLSRIDDDDVPTVMAVSVDADDTGEQQEAESAEEAPADTEEEIDEEAEAPEIDVMAGIVQAPKPEPSNPAEEKPAKAKKNSGGRKVQ